MRGVKSQTQDATISQIFLKSSNYTSVLFGGPAGLFWIFVYVLAAQTCAGQAACTFFLLVFHFELNVWGGPKHFINDYSNSRSKEWLCLLICYGRIGGGGLYVKVSIREMCQKRGLFCRCDIISKYSPILWLRSISQKWLKIGHTLTYARTLSKVQNVHIPKWN